MYEPHLITLVRTLTWVKEYWIRKRGVSTLTHKVYSVLGVPDCYQGQIEYRPRIENWRILLVTSPGDSTALSQCSYIWPAELRNLYSQTFILEMLTVIRYLSRVPVYRNEMNEGYGVIVICWGCDVWHRSANIIKHRAILKQMPVDMSWLIL